jgi:hypothetical protein
MTPEKQELLYNKYPNLFINKDKNKRESCMAWGVAVDDGWFDIVESMCRLINHHENNLKLRNKEFIPVTFDQIKEKFGGLTVYYSGGDERIQGIVGMSEQISYKICEVCGNKGQPTKGGWIKTLCSDCLSKKSLKTIC